MIAILEKIAVPRPNQSEAMEKTAAYIKGLLAQWDIPFTVQTFALSPYLHAIVGFTCLVLAVLLFVSVLRKKPAPAIIAALSIPALMLLELEFFIPIVSNLVQKSGENIIVNFTAPDAVRELIFCAHYDSKTDFWDHAQRAMVYRFIPIAVITGILLSLWTLFTAGRNALAKGLPRAVSLALAGIFVFYFVLLSLGFGGFVFIPSRSQSFGAADNAGSVVTLLALARDISGKRAGIGSSNVTILLTAGEEVNLQGAERYVRKYILEKGKGLPRYCVNLELAGQGGNLFWSRKAGIFLKYYHADSDLVSRIGSAWLDVSGRPMETVNSLADDSQRFMSAGIPSVTIGHTYMSGQGIGQLHSAKDNRGRINPQNLALMVKLLEKFIKGYR